MRISDLVRMGLRNLNRRRARTALTVIGIVIGTISITVMFSIGIGLNKSFEEQVMQMGSMTMITVNNYADTMNSNGDYTGSKKQKLDDKLVESIKQIPHVKMYRLLLM
jgi:ABC-type antimicrobial peptide transport system permease subunit